MIIILLLVRYFDSWAKCYFIHKNLEIINEHQVSQSLNINDSET